MTERNKVLVIEDEHSRRDTFKTILGDKVDLPIVNTESEIFPDREASLKNIDDCLRVIPYKVIFMDGELELGLEPRGRCDGAVLTDRIRQGFYGSLNQKVEIQNISSSFPIPGTRWDYWKNSIGKGDERDPIAYAKKVLKE